MLWFQFTNIGTIEFGKLLQACTNVNLTAAQFLKITFTTKLNLDQSFKINFDVDLRRSDINQKVKRHKLHRNKYYKIRHPQYESLKFKPHISFVFLAILCTLGTCLFVVCNVFLQTKSRILQEFQQLKIFDHKIFFAIIYVYNRVMEKLLPSAWANSVQCTKDVEIFVKIEFLYLWHQH